MATTFSQNMADLTAAMQKMSDDDTKFRADVLAALAVVGSGPLTPEQQAAFDNLMNLVQSNDAATLAADAALPQATPTP